MLTISGWPERIYLIGRNGRVVYKSKPGPFGFHAADLDPQTKLLLR